MALFRVIQNLTKIMIVVHCNVLRIAHYFLYVYLLMNFKQIIYLFILKSVILDPMNLLKVKYYSIAVVLGVNLLRLVGKATLSHVESKVYLIRYELGSVRQELAEQIKAVNVPAELEGVEELVLLVAEVLVAEEFAKSVLGEEFGELLDRLGLILLLLFSRGLLFR